MDRLDRRFWRARARSNLRAQLGSASCARLLASLPTLIPHRRHCSDRRHHKSCPEASWRNAVNACADDFDVHLCLSPQPPKRIAFSDYHPRASQFISSAFIGLTQPARERAFRVGVSDALPHWSCHSYLGVGRTRNGDHLQCRHFWPASDGGSYGPTGAHAGINACSATTCAGGASSVYPFTAEAGDTINFGYVTLGTFVFGDGR